MVLCRFLWICLYSCTGFDNSSFKPSNPDGVFTLQQMFASFIEIYNLVIFHKLLTVTEKQILKFSQREIMLWEMGCEYHMRRNVLLPSSLLLDLWPSKQVCASHAIYTQICANVCILIGWYNIIYWCICIIIHAELTVFVLFLVSELTVNHDDRSISIDVDWRVVYKLPYWLNSMLDNWQKNKHF